MFRDLARNRRGLLLIGAALAVAAFAVVVLLLNKQNTATPTTYVPTASATLAPGMPTVTATPTVTPETPGLSDVQAVKDVPTGLKIVDAATILTYFKTSPLPAGAVPVSNVLTSTDVLITDVLSNTVQVVKPIRKGTLVTVDAFQLLPFSPPGSLSYQVRAGRVAESFQISLLNSDNGSIVPGDFVDVLLTLHDKDLSPFTANPPDSPNSGPIQTQELLPNIRVIDVKPGGLYTMELTPQQSLLMKYVKDYGGNVEIVLMSAADVKAQATQPTTNVVVPSYFLTPIAAVTGSATPQTNGLLYPFSTPVSTPTAGATVTR